MNHPPNLIQIIVQEINNPHLIATTNNNHNDNHHPTTIHYTTNRNTTTIAHIYHIDQQIITIDTAKAYSDQNPYTYTDLNHPNSIQQITDLITQLANAQHKENTNQ